MYTSGDRASWLNAVAAKIMDGGVPPSIDYLLASIPREILTRENDGHVTAAAALGEKARKDYQAGWRIIIGEMVTVLREQGFVGGSDQALTWMKPVDGTWKVAMDDGRQMTVFGQRERRMDRDRSIVGERNEIDGGPVVGVPPSLFEHGRMHPFTLQVTGPRGGITEQSFELHPLALAIPPMTEAERETLRKSIERDGVKVPIEIYQKKILDGRNRAYFASVFKKPVHIKIFEGTEEEARRHVAILNLHRRHLSGPQLAVVAIKLFGEQSHKETADAHQKAVTGPRQTRGKSRGSNDKEDRSGRWENRVANAAKEVGINISPDSVAAMNIVMDAPETLAKVENQEIKIVADAAAEARKEKGMPKATKYEGASPRTIGKHCWEAIKAMEAIVNSGLEMKPGGDETKLSERCDQIEALAPQVRQALRKRKMIP